MEGDKEHEAKCLRCGRCCCTKNRIDGRVVSTGIPCENLDVATKLCRVYRDRHSVKKGCGTVEEGIRDGAFPGDCPYVQGVPGYVGFLDPTKG